MTEAGLGAMKGGVDLTGESRFGHASGFSPGGYFEHWKDAVRPTHGLPAMDDIYPLCSEVWWRSSRSHVALHRAVPHHGLRPIDLPGKSARHRGVSDGASRQALPYGRLRAGAPRHTGRRQRVARLAHLRRFCAATDCAGAQALRQRRPGVGVVKYGLCLGLDDHRSVPVALPLGHISEPPRLR